MPINKLLFVDDDPSMLEIFPETLSELTPNIDTADSRDSALERIRSARYDLIVLDGLGGGCFQVCREAKNSFQGEVVILSGDVRIGIEAKKLGIPFYDKPSEITKLIEDYRGK